MIFKKITLLFLCLCFGLQLLGQEGSFTQIERLIEAEIPREMLSTTKGWKFNHRWLDEFNKRVDPDGNFYDGAVFYAEAERLAQRKNNSNLESNTGWIPLGPTGRADASLTKGMGRINCITFHPTDPDIFWVGVAQGGVWKTTNGGQSWTPLADNLPILRINDIAVDQNNPDIMYVCLGDYAYVDSGLSLDDRKRHSHYGLGIYKSTDGGSTWNPTGLTYQLEELDGSLMRRVFIDPDNADNLVAGGVGGIWTSADGGDNWTQRSNELIWDIEADPNNHNIVFATSGFFRNTLSGNAGILKSTDFGATWTTLNTGIPLQGEVTRIEVSVAPSNSNHIYALAANTDRGLYGVYTSFDGGINWILINDGETNILEWFDGNNSGGQGTYDLSLAIDPLNEFNIYTGGVNIWGSNDGGVNFDGVSIWYDANGPGHGIHADQHQFKYNPLDGKLYVCNDGGLIRTDNIMIGSWDQFNSEPGYDWPTTWEYISDGMQTSSFYRVGVSEGNPGNFIAGAQDNSTYFKNNGSWSNLFGGDGMNAMLHPSDPDKIFGSSQFGRIIYSNNGGFDQFRMRGPNNENGAWVTPFMYKPGTTNTVYAGFGNLVAASPGEDFETFLSDFPNINGSFFPTPISHFNVAASNPDYLYVAKRVYHSFDENAMFWVSEDGGNSWTDKTAGLPDDLFYTFVEVDNDDPLSAWVVLGGYEVGEHVYHTSNAGDTWENITTNLPNLPINCIVQNDSSLLNTVYVATDLGVYYSNDTTENWHPYNLNLPNVIVSDLEINYSENKIYAATFGRGVWQNDLIDETDMTTNVQTVDPFASTVIDLYPNPNNGEFELAIDGFSGSALTMELIDVMGRIVHADQLAITNGTVKQSFNIELPDGLYFLKISSEKRMRTIRFNVD